MRFNFNQKLRFDTPDGAYSTITVREHDDSQITLADHEANLVLEYFGESNIWRGSVRSNPGLAEKELKLYPSGDSVLLNLNFPKEQGNELRLYLNRQFKPESGSVFFLFVKDSRLWVGSMPEPQWRAESAEVVRDETDALFQEILSEENEIRISQLESRDVFRRDRSVALKSMQNSRYVCEYDHRHELFISRSLKKPYLEAHHLIPMRFQAEFDSSLDIVENVFCLCPNCHRAIHHAIDCTARLMLDTLVDKRDVLTGFDLTGADLNALYGVEEFTDG